MKFESVAEAAERLGVTARTVQLWAKEGKLPGAYQLGRAWLIPAESVKPEKMKIKKEAVVSSHLFMPLLQATYTPGKLQEYIDSIENSEDREIAQAQLLYSRGQLKEASDMVEIYIDSKDFNLSLSASLIYSMSNMSLGRVHLTHFGLECMRRHTKEAVISPDRECAATAIIAERIVSMQLGVPTMNLPPLRDYIPYVSEGLRLMACYILAFEMCMKGLYQKAVGIADTAMAMSLSSYPVVEIYINIIIASALICQKEIEHAKLHYMRAWEIGCADGFIQAFGEGYALLHGLPDSCLKNKYPAELKRIISVMDAFNNGRRRMNENDVLTTTADDLTAQEFIIVLLYIRSWLVKEIAAHLNISERMVKHHLSIVYQKIGISSRESLKKYMFY